MLKKSLFLVFICLVNATWDEQLIEDGIAPNEIEYKMLFERFLSNYKSPSMSIYEHYSEQSRFEIFKENVDRWVQHNNDESQTWKMGMTQFADWTKEEKREYVSRGALQADQHCSATNQTSVLLNNQEKRPFHWDWRHHNGVSPVKDQGSCGSCWTFSTVGALEAHSMIKYKGEFDSLSEQQLVDCAGDYDNHGCEGGLPSHAFEYIMHNGGIGSEVSYPYEGVDQNCTFNNNDIVLAVDGGSVNITEGDEESLANAVFQHGPVSIAFEVVDDFSDYVGGVYSSSVCKNSTQDVNHAVVAVGYGRTWYGENYWVVKNSWGLNWGVEGYFKIKRGVNMCGVAVCNSYPQSVRRTG